MSTEQIVLLTIFVPIVGSLTIPLAGAISRSARSAWSLILGAATAILPLFLLPAALGGGEEILRYPSVLGLNFTLIVDPLAIFMSIVSSFVGFLIILYSVGYIAHEDNQNEYYLMVVLFIGSMMGLVYSANLIFMYLFWEIIAIACWRLIGFYRVKEHVVKADKAFLITFFGAAMMLLGFVVVYGNTQTFDLVDMRGTLIPGAAVLLILFGMFSKSATVPLHTWLPDAGVAPTTVTALLHAAVLVKIGVYAYARIFLYTFDIPSGWKTAIPIIAVVSSLVAAGAATVENDFKRILAYSTVSQIGYIFLGFSVATPDGIVGLDPVHPDARTGESRPLPLRRDRHPRHPQAGHPGDGRADQDHALHRRGFPGLRLLRHRHPALRRVLLEIPGHRRHGQGRPGLGRRRRPVHGRPDDGLPPEGLRDGLPG